MSTRRGFTLIELLVAISIIALLIAVLLPALRAARETAKMAQCASQIRMAGVAHWTYVGDFEAFTYAGLVRTGATLSWDDNLAPYFNVQMTPTQRNNANSVAAWGDGPLGLSLLCPNDPDPQKNRRSYRMPGHTNANEGGQVNGGTPYGSGGMGVLQTNPSLPIRTPRPEDVLAASGTMLGFELANHTAVNEGLGNWRQSTVSWAYFQNSLLSQRLHGGTYNYLFVDGHVQRLEAKETVQNGDPDRADPAAAVRPSNRYWSLTPRDF